MESDNQYPEDPRNELQKEIEELKSGLDDLHGRYHKATEFIGYARDSVIKSAPIWISIADGIQSNPENLPFVYGALNDLRNLNAVVKREKEKVSDLVGDTMALSAGSAVFASATGTTADLLGMKQSVILLPSPQSEYQKEKQIASQLESYDSELGKLYRQVDDVIHVTRSEADRPILVLWRQFFDHLFDKLAPDDKVRNSPFFQKKKGEKPDQVTRIERIRYAAFTHVKDPSQARLLSGQAEQVNKIYSELNKLHKRGPLNLQQSRHAAETMKNHMLQWAIALGAVSIE